MKCYRADRPAAFWIAALALLAFPAAALADDVACSDLGGKVEEYLNANLVVDKNCKVDDAFVNGNVLFAGDYHLYIDDSEINGNIECNGLGSLSIDDSEINGNLVDCHRGKPWKDDRFAFKASLDGLQEVPAVSTTGKGRFHASADREGMELRYALRYEDLEGGDVLFAHIHFGNRGTNGGVIAWLCSNTPPPMGVDTPACPAEGEVLEGTLDPFDVVGPESQGIAPGEAREALRALMQGAAYVNVHTDFFEDGEIRGQIAAKKNKKSKKKKRR